MKVLKKLLGVLSLLVTVIITGSFAACNILSGDISEGPVGLIADYEQSTEVFEDTPLNDLQADLKVWLEMADETVEQIDDYTLSGTLAVGESEITVTYDLKSTLTTTFTVVVSEGYVHEHEFTDYVSDNNATCQEDGTKTAECDLDFCQATDTITDEGSMLEHVFENYESNNDAECEKDGTKTGSCKYGCGETDTITDEGSALSHVFTNYVSDNNATCQADGTKTAECDLGCGKTDTVEDVGSTVSHAFENYVSDGNATCKEDGTKTGSCKFGCGETDTIADENSKISHVFENYESNNDAECEKDGTKTGSCKFGCGETDTITDEGSALSHVFTNYVSDNNATCLADGTKTAECDLGCGKTDTAEDEGSMLSHVFTNYVSDNNAKCEEDGTKTATCDNGCGETDTVADEGSALGHSYTNYASNNDAKCEEDGTKTATCDNGCGATDTIADEGSALEHIFTNYISNNDAEIGKDGTKTATCERDNCKETDTIPDEGSALEHSYTNYVSDNNATCTEDGTKTATCDNGCGTKKTIPDVGSALGHSYTNYVSDNNATCTEDGTKTATCDNGCGETDTVADVGSALGHSYTNYVSDNNAKCEEDGTKTATCDNGCGETDTVADEDSALGHSYTNYVSNNDATCTEDGTKTATCDNGCGETDTVADEGSMLSHAFDNYVSDGNATCLTDGTKTAECGYGCGETDTVADEGSALGHTFKLGVCERCPETNYLSIVTTPSVASVYYGEQPAFTDGVVQNELGETVTNGTWSIIWSTSDANYLASATTKEIAGTATLIFNPNGTEYNSISKNVAVTLLAVAKYGNNYYTTIDGALNAANASNSGTVYSLPLEYEIDSGRAKIAKTIAVVTEIKSGVTLTLPYAEDKLDTTVSYVFTGDNSEYKQTAYGKTKFLMNQIYIVEEHTLYSAGTMNVAGQVCGGAHMNYNTSGNANSLTAGRHAQINLGANAKLISTGTVNCYGFINEEEQNNGSEFIVEKGKATVMFTIVEYRGGQRYFGMIDPTNSKVKEAIASAAQNGISGDPGKYTPDTLQASPFNRFYIESVTAKTTVKYGAQMLGYVVLYADSDNQYTTLNVINNSNGIIALTNQAGSVTYKYDYTTRKTDLDIYGDMTLNPLNLTLSITKSEMGISTTIELTLTTGATGASDGVFFPLSDLFDVSLNAINGSATVNASGQKVKLLPGAKLTIGKGVVVNASEIAVYVNNDLFLNGADKHYTTSDPAELIVSGTLNVQAIGGEITAGDDGALLNISGATSVISKEIKTMAPSATVPIKVMFITVNLPYVTAEYSSEEDSTLVATKSNGKLLHGNELFARNGKWVSNIVYVDLQLNGGTASTMPNQLYDNGYVMNVSELPVPTRTDYLFMGWYTTENFESGTEFTTTLALTDDVTFYAKWVSNAIYVNMQLNGGTGSTVSGPYNYLYEIKVSELPTPTRPDYNFMGWYTTENFESGTEFTGQTLTEDVTVYAKWELKEGTIIVQFATTSKNADDIAKTQTFAMQTIGEASKTATYPAEALACNEDALYARYVSGYYADKACTIPFDFSQEITQDTTIYVTWAAKLRIKINTGRANVAEVKVNGKTVVSSIQTYYYVLSGAEFTLTTKTIVSKQVNIAATYTQDGESVTTNYSGTEKATATLTVESNTTFVISLTAIS